LELFPGHAGTQFMKAYQLVAETGEQIVLEDEYRGETIANSNCFRIIVVPTGHDIAILAQNITARKRTEVERQKFAMLADSSSEFIGMCDLDLKPIYVNPAGMRMVGLPDMEAACRVMVPDYFFPEDQQFIREDFFPRVLREGHGEVEIRLRHFQTGEPIWVSYYLYHVRDANGKLVGWATVSRDITERKQAKEEVRKLNAELEQRVADRTAELAAKAAELERVNRVFVGRELRMRELKEQIAELEKK
jgi:PAS domain S-box-containing protein